MSESGKTELTADQKRLRTFYDSVDSHYSPAVAVVCGAVIIAGLVMIAVGKWEQGGDSYLSDSIVYQLRPAGFVVAAIGLVTMPIGLLLAAAVRAWAQHAADS